MKVEIDSFCSNFMIMFKFIKLSATTKSSGASKKSGSALVKSFNHYHHRHLKGTDSKQKNLFHIRHEEKVTAVGTYLGSHCQGSR